MMSNYHFCFGIACSVFDLSFVEVMTDTVNFYTFDVVTKIKGALCTM